MTATCVQFVPPAQWYFCPQCFVNLGTPICAACGKRALIDGGKRETR